MNAKLTSTARPWVDPDDAPELTDEVFDKGVWKIGDRVVPRKEGETAMRKAVRQGRPPAERTKRLLTVRYDEDIVAAFKATGRCWQTRMNNALRECAEEPLSHVKFICYLPRQSARPFNRRHAVVGEMLA